MPASWKIIQAGRVVETHSSLRDAEIAFWILTAHELKNGRVANLELDTRSCDSVTSPSKLVLPSWAKDVLIKEGCYDL